MNKPSPVVWDQVDHPASIGASEVSRPFAEFTDDLRVGHEDIDRQHASLFDAVNRLHDAMRSNSSRQVQGDILAFLRSYTIEHFEAEVTSQTEAALRRLLWRREGDSLRVTLRMTLRPHESLARPFTVSSAPRAAGTYGYLPEIL